MKIKSKFVTKSKYWEYEKFNANPSLSILIKLKKLIENIFNIRIFRKKKFEILNELHFYPVSKKILELRNKKLVKIFQKFLGKLRVFKTEKNLIKLIKDHDKLFFNSNPVKDNLGGMGYNNSLYLFVYLSVQKKVDMFVESGIWKGYSSFLIDSALKKKNDDAEHYKFDINFKNIKYFSKKANYFEFDINEYEFPKSKKNKIFFFDDHVSHYDRLQYCYNNDVEQIIFDDDVDFESVHSDGWPPIPTISMLLSKNKISRFTWKSFDGLAKASYNIKKINYNILKRYLISQTINISHITGYNNQSRMVFLKKK